MTPRANAKRAMEGHAFEFYATCPAGFEASLADELRKLGAARVRPLKGRVSFAGAAIDGERACLWSRLASRVFVVIARFEAVGAEELYEGARAVAWERVLRHGSTIAVSARGTTPELRNSHFTALRVKDAVCDRLADETGLRPGIDLERPDARIAVALRRERVSIALDLSGDPLFRRLPRTATLSGAPDHVLRPDYAALLLARAGFSSDTEGSDGIPVLVDASCAGGGAALEAAQIALDRAPGLPRRHWGFQGWAEHDADAWYALVQAAQGRADAAAIEPLGRIVALNERQGTLTYAQRVLRAAGVAQAVDFAVAGSDAALNAVRRALAQGAVRVGGERAADLEKTVDTSVTGNEACDMASIDRDDAPTIIPGASAPDVRAIMVADTLELPPAGMRPLAERIHRLRAIDPVLDRAPLAVVAPDEVLIRALGARPTEILPIMPNNEEAVLMSWENGLGKLPDAAARSAAETSTATGSRPAPHMPAPSIDGGAAGATAVPATVPASAAGTALSAATLGAPEASTPAAVSTTNPSAAPRRRPVGARRGSGAADQLSPSATVDLGRGKPVPILVAESEQFANRLKKNARLRRKWARRTGVTCYRVYDADLPDYSAAIDLYEGSAATPGRWLIIAEYAAPKTIEPELAQARMLDILTVAPIALEVAPEHVYARSRTKSRGGSQYGKLGTGAAGHPARAAGTPAPHPFIEEGGLTFEVDFSSYLDTGIFLDHRVTRGLVRDRARELAPCRFLNLFAYTGTATCYAADGGAVETVTVDLSNTYLDWTERNLAANGFTGPEHHIVRADVLAWIDDMRRAGHTWNLIFCDPPTFSNSAKMGERTWDVQRDHVELLRGVADLLDRRGLAIFSCNLRGFRPDRAALEAAGIELTDITARTIPEDFARNQKIHHCYEVRRLG